jgi:hypothetical protein
VAAALTDPSALSTAVLQREIANLSERVDLKIEGLARAYDARLEAIDRATDKFESSLVRVPTETDKAIASLRGLMDQKFSEIQTHLAGMQKLKDEQFRAIQQQFGERDTRYQGERDSAKEAIAAALQAAKEAVGKSEVAQVKAIEQQSSQIRTVTDANNAQITDIKERLTRIEAIAIGQASQKQETTASTGVGINVIAVILTVVSVAIAAFALAR